MCHPPSFLLDDQLLLQAACTAARLASVLPDPETSLVATEFLDSLGLSRQQFGSWSDVAVWLGERVTLEMRSDQE